MTTEFARLAPGSRPTAGRVLIVSGSVGAGHDGAARELAVRLRDGGVDVDVRDFLTAVPRWDTFVLGEGYIWLSRRAPRLFQSLFSSAERPGHGGWFGFRFLAAWGARTLTRWLETGDYDVVVSTYPPSSLCLGRLRERGRCRIPVITYVTDPAVHAGWVDPAVDLHVTVTQASAEQGRADHGIATVAGGPLVPSRFEKVPSEEVDRVRADLGLGRDTPVALIVAGSLGVGDVRETAADVARAGFRPVVLCGRNAALRRDLARVPEAVPLGWRDDVHVLMAAADVLVHNAGGLSFTEAMVAGLPAVTYRPIPGHGRANAALLDRAGLVPWAHDREELATMLRQQAAAGRRPGLSGDPAELVRGLLSRVRQESV